MDLKILSNFVDLMMTAYSVKSIAANQGNTSPAKPYATVNFLNESPFGFNISEKVDIPAQPLEDPPVLTSLDILRAQNYSAQIEVIFYSDSITGTASSRALANYFYLNMYSTAAKKFQFDNSFSIHERRPALNIDYQLGGESGDKWEKRSLVEFTINFVDTATETGVDYFNEQGVSAVLTVDHLVTTITYDDIITEEEGN